ncbi:MAG: Hsp33 family molecular chaperone HslO [Desulfobacterales bacterium]|jgi:molecular chaperone Hsp33
MEKLERPGEDLKDRLKAGARDRLHRFFLSDGDVRGALVHGTRLVQEMRARHELGLLETLVLGHACLGGLLMASSLKGDDRVALKIECSGPVGGLVVEASAHGDVRGYLHRVPIPVAKPLEDFNLSPFFGAGFLTVIRYLHDAKQPFTSQVALEHGNLAQDLAHYYLTSEQIPTAFNLSIKFTPEGGVAGAGGLFLQVMPGAAEATPRKLEEIVYNLPSLGDVCAGGEDLEHFLQSQFDPLDPVLLDKPRVSFFCPCRRAGVARVLGMLPLEELKDMRDKGPFPVELRCHYCNTRYQFEREAIGALYEARSGGN